VVVILDDERVPVVIIREIELRIAELIGPGRTYSGNPDLSAKNWFTLMVKDP